MQYSSSLINISCLFSSKFGWYNLGSYNSKTRVIRTNFESPWGFELQEFKCNRFHESYNAKHIKEITRLKSLQTKSRGVFKTQASICDGDIWWIYLTAYYFNNKSSFINVRLGYIQVSKNIEIFKVKLRYSKLSRLLQRVAFRVTLISTHTSITWI